MAFTSTQLEEIVSWCSSSSELAKDRKQARRTFFAEDDRRPVRYLSGADDGAARDRRFLGWFLFDFRLPDGTRPSELAINRLYTKGSNRADALRAVQNARYVLALVSTVVAGKGVLLSIEDERFDVRSSQWSRLLARDQVLVTYLVPTRGQHTWIPGPGWLLWPMQFGPNMRAHLKQYQPDPLEIERVLQSRQAPADGATPEERPLDDGLAEAVARMTEAAQKDGRTKLILSVEEWRTLVLDSLKRNNPTALAMEIIQRAGSGVSQKDLNRYLDLAMNIMHTTPQPDQGGRTIKEILAKLPGFFRR